MNKINMSPDAHELLQVQGDGLFLTESRGEIDIKGKGSTEVGVNSCSADVHRAITCMSLSSVFWRDG